MKRGRRPTPIALRVLRGNPGRRPIAQGPVAPATGAVVPKWLSREAKIEWQRLAPELERLGLLTVIDQAVLAAACETWADVAWATREIRRCGRVVTAPNGTVMAHPAVAIQRGAMKELRAFATEFGLTPSSRSGLRWIGTPDEADDPDDARFFAPHLVPRPKGEPQ
jgi:P27 family predicted phage terminase small subunit